MTTAPATSSEKSIAAQFVAGVSVASPTVLALAQDAGGDVPIADLESMIAGDPEFSLRVLALANSAFYSQQHDIASLRSALVVLGADTVRNLAASLLSRSLLATPRQSDSSAWRHAQAAGVAAQMIAEVHRRADPQRAFVAGLLHDVGISALLAYGNPEAPDIDSHVEVGGEIAELLGLAPCLISAIRQHDTLDVDADSDPLDVTVALANRIAIRAGYSHEAENAGDDDHHCCSALNLLGLGDADIDAMTIGLTHRIEAFENGMGQLDEVPA